MNVLVVVSSFLAAGVEWVEALTIVLAVGVYKSWRAALLGAAVAVGALAILVAVFGVAVTSHVSITLARTLVGVFLLLFGLKWLHKAILRSAGVHVLHDEAAAFQQTGQDLASSRHRWIGFSTSFSGVFLEGLEVVFIVTALGGLRGLGAASAGALGSLALVVAAGAVLRQPLTRVPENAMKYVVGIMLTSFGTFFTGEGLGVRWWGDDVSILILVAAYGVASLLLVLLLKRPSTLSLGEAALARGFRTVALELWGLFVGDGGVATVAIAVVLGVGLFSARGGAGFVAAVLLVAGVLLAVMVGLTGSLRERLAVREASDQELRSEAAPAAAE